MPKTPTKADIAYELLDVPLLTSGSSHPSVQLLGRTLERLGYETTISAGQNFDTIDASVTRAIEQFRIDHDCHEDASGFVPAEQTYADRHTGPAFLAALGQALKAS